MSTSQDARLIVGLVGLGNMGTAMAERVLAADFQLGVYNRTHSKANALAAGGAFVAGTPAELVAEVDAVLTSLPNDDVFGDVAERIVAAARPGAVLIDTSTVSAAASARIASLAEAASVEYLRAPVSGNPSVVRAGNLTFIVSGDRETLARVEPLLRAIGPTIHYVGDGERARVVKLAINLMVAGLAQLMSEALVLGEAAGVSKEDLLEVMGSSAAGAPFVQYKAGPLLHDDFSATFTTALMEKDLDLVLAAAEENRVQLPVARELKGLLRETIEAGYGDDDFMALYLQLRNAAGTEVVR